MKANRFVHIGNQQYIDAREVVAVYPILAENEVIVSGLFIIWHTTYITGQEGFVKLLVKICPSALLNIMKGQQSLQESRQ